MQKYWKFILGTNFAVNTVEQQHLKPTTYCTHKPESSVSECFNQIINQHGICQRACVSQSLKQIRRAAFRNGRAMLT